MAGNQHIKCIHVSIIKTHVITPAVTKVNYYFTICLAIYPKTRTLGLREMYDMIPMFHGLPTLSIHKRLKSHGIVLSISLNKTKHL